MAGKHPYVTSNGPLIQVINHIRKSFPATVNADTLKKLGYAKKNESYVINTLRFLGIIDEDGKKTDKAGKIFSSHDNNTFQKEFSGIIEKAYTELFSLHKDAWLLDMDSLITFFRQTDQSSSLVGKKQANTFKALAGLSGHAELPEHKRKKTGEAAKRTTDKTKQKPSLVKQGATQSELENPIEQTSNSRNQIGLTVRIEINLPAEGDQATYDRIFKSIRENLLNG